MAVKNHTSSFVNRANAIIENEAQENERQGEKWLEIRQQDPLSPFVSFHFTYSLLVHKKERTTWHAPPQQYVSRKCFGLVSLCCANASTWSFNAITEIWIRESESNVFKGLIHHHWIWGRKTVKSREKKEEDWTLMQLICHNLQSFTKNTVALSSSRGIGPTTQCHVHVQTGMERSSLVLTQQHRPNDDSILEIF